MSILTIIAIEIKKSLGYPDEDGENGLIFNF
jgi:hypothetical protein